MTKHRSRQNHQIESVSEDAPVGLYEEQVAEVPTVPAPSAHKGLNRATLRALRRVGASVERQLGWLLDLAHIDYERLGERERRGVGQELFLFLLLRPLNDAPARLVRAYVETIPLQAILEGVPGSPERMLPEKQTKEAHAWLSQGIASIETGRSFNFDLEIKSAVRLWSPTARQRQTLRISEQPSVSDVLTRFAARTYETLSAGKSVIRRCAECQHLFVPAHALQNYCSQRCSQRIRTRKWRRNHPEKAKELRHAQYRREVSRQPRGESIAKHIRRRGS
jgi:hypothetical protein